MFGDLWGDLAVKIIGRIREKDILSSCLSSKRLEFVVVYGRRRVGKTFLIKDFFKQPGKYRTSSSNLPRRLNRKNCRDYPRCFFVLCPVKRGAIIASTE